MKRTKREDKNTSTAYGKDEKEKGEQKIKEENKSEI